jgi:hypothetical protein
MDLMMYGVVFLVLTLSVVVLLKLNSPARGSDDQKIQGMLASAALAKRNGDHQQSAMLYEQAIGSLDAAHKTDEALLCTALAGRAESLERLGERKASQQLIGRVISIWQSALAAGRVDFLTDVDYLATNADFGSSTAEVARFYETVLAYREKRVPPHSSEFINTVVIYAKLNRTLGETALAEQLEQHAEKLRHGGSSTVEQLGSDGPPEVEFDNDAPR